MLLRTCDLNPAGYHGLARFLHVANTALIYFILRRLVTSRAGAAVGAMLFASQALFSLTNGAWNTALGLQALYYNTSGSYNTAVGVRRFSTTPPLAVTPPLVSMRSLAAQEEAMQALFTQTKEQAMQIQKVSAQLEMRNPAPQTLLNSQ